MVTQGDQAVDVQHRPRLCGQGAGDLIVVAMDGDGVCIEQVCVDRVGSLQSERTVVGECVQVINGGGAEFHHAVGVDDACAGQGYGTTGGNQRLRAVRGAQLKAQDIDIHVQCNGIRAVQCDKDVIPGPRRDADVPVTGVAPVATAGIVPEHIARLDGGSRQTQA